MEVNVSTDAIKGLLKILNLEAHIPNVFSTVLLGREILYLATCSFSLIDTLAYGFIKYSFKGNASSPTRTNGNSLASPYPSSALVEVC